MYVDYKKLLDKIQQNNFSITQMLEIAGCSYAVIASIKNGKNLSKKTVWKLATALGCRVNDLLKVSRITELPLKPTWHEGEETKKEEALWPYAECLIADYLILTQNIGTLKAMARDKARNRKVKVPVVVHLPNGEDYTIVFHPDGHQTMSQTIEIQKGANHAERRESEKMPSDTEQVRVPAPDVDGHRRVQRITESYLQDASVRDYSDAAKREFQRRNRGRDRHGDPGCHDGQPECGGD